jgi:hypothetical protein
MSLSKNLDEMLEFFKNGERPEYIFIEAVTDSLGLFSADCVFIAARDGCEARIVIDPCEENKVGMLYHVEGSLKDKKVYPPVLRLAFKVDDRPESHRITPYLAEEFVAAVNYNIEELIGDY